MGFVCYTSQLEPKNVKEALGDESWITALQEKLNQFTRNDVWYLVPRTKDKHVIVTKWIFKNKQDQNCEKESKISCLRISQIKRIDFEDTFALIARLESIRILLTIKCSLRIKLFQMDVKSDFLNAIMCKEVYVEQPKGFKDPEFPNHVYRLKITLYGLKQAPRAWCERLTTYFFGEKVWKRGN